MDAQMPNVSPATAAMPPKSGVPKTVGVLNVVFGSALALGGVCCGLYVLMLSAMSPMLATQQQQMQQQIQANQEAQREAQLKQLDEQEQAATSEEEKQSIRQQRQALESAPLPAMPAMPDMTKMYGLNDPRVLAYSLTDMLSGVLLNILLIISGAGLIGMREWARKMAIGLAATKIVRLVILQAISVFVVAPVVAKQMTEAMQQMMSQMQPGPGAAPPPQMGPEVATMYGVMMTVSAVCMLLFGSIYPAIVLWLLTRPKSKAACK